MKFFGILLVVGAFYLYLQQVKTLRIKHVSKTGRHLLFDNVWRVISYALVISAGSLVILCASGNAALLFIALSALLAMVMNFSVYLRDAGHIDEIVPWEIDSVILGAFLIAMCLTVIPEV